MRTAILLILCIFFSGVSAQEALVRKGDVIVDGYFGYPYLGSAILRATYGGPEQKASVKSINHLGLRVEYVLTETIGVGVEGTYSAAEVGYQKDSIRYSAGIVKYRILGKFNFHLAGNKQFDLYLTSGVGYLNQRYYQTEPGANHLSSNSFIEAQVPVAGRIGLGMRYFFTKNIGLNVEVGLGGSLLSGGISCRIN